MKTATRYGGHARPLTRHRNDEQGSAMIIAITVVMIIAMLTLSVMANSLHQLSGVAETDQQVSTVHSAEGGVDLAISQMQSTKTLGGLPCNIPVTNLVTSTITANYTVSVTYYDSSGATLSCPTPQTSTETYYSGSTTPATAKIVSQGSSNSHAYGAQSMAAQVQLSTNYTTGAFFNGAIFSNSSMTWINKTTIEAPSGNGDIYSNGDFICNNVSTINGNVYVYGNFTATNVCNTTGSWWSHGYVNDKNGSAVGGNVIATGSGACASGYQVCFNNAAGSVAGYVQAAGAVNNKETVKGTISQNQSNMPSFPTYTFDQYNFKSSDWCGSYVSATTNCSNGTRVVIEANNGCTQAEADMVAMSVATMPTVIYVPGTCTVSWTGSLVLSLNKNLIVFAEGGFKFGNTVSVTSTGATELYLVVPYASGDWSSGSGGTPITCTGSAPSLPGEYFVNKVTMPTTNFYTFMYTPCTVWLNNNGAIAGQLYGGNVNLVNQVDFTYVAPSLPNQAVSNSNLFNVGLLYDRQVTP